MIDIAPKNKLAGFDVDAQNCFTPLCPDELPVPDGHTIADALNDQARLAAFRVGSKDAHPETSVWVATGERPQLTPLQGHKNADLHWNMHGVPGTYGFQLLEGLPPVTEYDFFVWKGVEPDLHPYGACYHDHGEQRSTGVIEFLKSKGIETVLVGGLALDYCVKLTVLQLLKAGFRVVVNQSATRALAPETGQMAVIAMKAAGAEFINSLDEVMLSNMTPGRLQEKHVERISKNH